MEYRKRPKLQCFRKWNRSLKVEVVMWKHLNLLVPHEAPILQTFRKGEETPGLQ
jgi:hypothetical protein